MTALRLLLRDTMKIRSRHGLGPDSAYKRGAYVCQL